MADGDGVRAKPYTLQHPLDASQVEGVDEMFEMLFADLRNGNLSVAMTQLSGTLPVTSGGTGLSTVVQGDLLYGSAADTLARLAKDANVTRSLTNTGTSNNPAWAQVALATGVSGDLPFANLTQGSALSVLGVTGNATADHASIVAASDHQVLRRSGTAVAFGAVNLSQAAALTGDLPVSNLSNGTHTVVSSTATGTQNNWAPGLDGDTVIFWNGASAMTVTGFDGGVTGQVITFKNISAAQTATFSHDSASSDADNQLQNMATSAGSPVAPTGVVVYQYNGTDWKMVGHNQGTWISPTFAAGDFTASGTMTWTVAAGDVILEKYCLMGKTLYLSYYIATTTVGGTLSNILKILIPGGFTSVNGVFQPIYILDNGVRAIGIALINGTSIDNYKVDVSNWAAATDATYVIGSLAFEVT